MYQCTSVQKSSVSYLVLSVRSEEVERGDVEPELAALGELAETGAEAHLQVSVLVCTCRLGLCAVLQYCQLLCSVDSGGHIRVNGFIDSHTYNVLPGYVTGQLHDPL